MYHQLIGKTVFFTRLEVRSMELANLDLLRKVMTLYDKLERLFRYEIYWLYRQFG
jgi:hypothetical protein